MPSTTYTTSPQRQSAPWSGQDTSESLSTAYTRVLNAYAQNDGDLDLKTEQDALTKEEAALNAAAKKLSAQKVAEARQKIAEAQKRIESAMKDKPGSVAVEEAAKEAAETAADTHAIIVDTSRSSRSREKSSGGSDGALAIPIVAIVFVFGWLTVRSVVNAFTQRPAAQKNTAAGLGQRLSEEEQAVLGRLQRTLTDMESRVEALETILIDHRRTKENYESKL